MSWIIPSPEWTAEILLIRELFDMNIPQAKALLEQYGSAEAAFENYKPCDSSL